jgi:predicted HTH domain antitoxin
MPKGVTPVQEAIVSVPLDAAAVEALGLGERWVQDARKRLALSDYADGLLSLGQAARLAGTTYMEFLTYLSERRVPLTYGPSDLDEDIQNLKQMGLWDGPVG